MKCIFHKKIIDLVIHFFSLDVDEDSGHFLLVSLDFLPRTRISAHPGNLPSLVNLDPEVVHISLDVISGAVGLKVALHGV